MKYIFSLAFVIACFSEATAQSSLSLRANSTNTNQSIELNEAPSPGSIQPTNTNNYPYALIAGGSKGIGYALAEALAKRNFNLILIARHLDSLVVAKNKLEFTYGIHVECLALDL